MQVGPKCLMGLMLLIACTPPIIGEQPTRALGPAEFGITTSNASAPVGLTIAFLSSSDYLSVAADGHTRYLSSVWRLENHSGYSLRNLTFHAYAPASSSLIGSALTRLATAGEEPISDPWVALSIRPTHAMEPGFLAPRVSADGASFQAFTAEEVAEVQRAGLKAGLLAEGDVVLGYGFSVSAPGGVIPDGGSGTLTISYRIPGANGPTAPYFMDVAFLVCEDRDARVTRSLEEGSDTAGVLARTDAIPGARVVLLGTPSQAEIDAVTSAGRAVTIVPSVSLSSGGTSMP
jgi:hypothetical protein